MSCRSFGLILENWLNLNDHNEITFINHIKEKLAQYKVSVEQRCGATSTQFLGSAVPEVSVSASNSENGGNEQQNQENIQPMEVVFSNGSTAHQSMTLPVKKECPKMAVPAKNDSPKMSVPAKKGTPGKNETPKKTVPAKNGTPAKSRTPKTRKVKMELESPAKRRPEDVKREIDFTNIPEDAEIHKKSENFHQLADDFKQLSVDSDSKPAAAFPDSDSEDFKVTRTTSSAFPMSDDEPSLPAEESVMNNSVNDLLEFKTMFHCKSCSFSSAYKGILVKHIKTVHFGEKPTPTNSKVFSCGFGCGMTFKTKATCKKHEDTHDVKAEARV